MEQNFQRCGVSCHNDELGTVAVKRLSRLVRALLKLLVVLRLSNDILDGLGKLWVSERVRL